MSRETCDFCGRKVCEDNKNCEVADVSWCAMFAVMLAAGISSTVVVNLILWGVK